MKKLIHPSMSNSHPIAILLSSFSSSLPASSPVPISFVILGYPIENCYSSGNRCFLGKIQDFATLFWRVSDQQANQSSSLNTFWNKLGSYCQSLGSGVLLKTLSNQKLENVCSVLLCRAFK